MVMNLHAKFEVSILNRSQDMEGGPKIPKVDDATPSWPCLI